MKNVLILICAFCANQAYCQLLSGSLVDDNRKLLTTTDFTLKGTKEGVVVYDLAVDIYGNVTSETLVVNMTTINSTPDRMAAKNLMKTFKFEPGTAYPKFHHVKVKVTFVTK